MLVGISPNERIRLALTACYSASADVGALLGLCQSDMDPLAGTAILRALQAACKRREKAGDDLHRAVADSADPRRPVHWSLRAHRWRHEPQGVCCDE